MLESVKGALRVTSGNPVIVGEIEDLIEGARLDLIQSGVSVDKANSDDALIKRAIVLYAKANYGLDNPNAERFGESYRSLKIKLSQASDYR